MESSNINSKFFLSKWEVSEEVESLRLEVSKDFLEVDSSTNHLDTPVLPITEVIEKASSYEKILVPSFKYVHPDLSVNEIQDRWSFTPDPKVAELAIVLNRLGLYTSSICEGHLDRELPFPQVSFWNEEFGRVLGYFREWVKSDGDMGIKIMSSRTEAGEVKGQMFSILFEGETLDEGQLKAKIFLDFLKSRSS